jgi:hypothetical protein
MIEGLIKSEHYDKITGQLTASVSDILTDKVRENILKDFRASISSIANQDLKALERRVYNKLRKTCAPNGIRRVKRNGNTYTYQNSMYSVYIRKYSGFDSLNIGTPTGQEHDIEKNIHRHVKAAGDKCYLMKPIEGRCEIHRAVAVGHVTCKVLYVCDSNTVYINEFLLVLLCR